jgi:putative membrane protein
MTVAAGAVLALTLGMTLSPSSRAEAQEEERAPDQEPQDEQTAPTPESKVLSLMHQANQMAIRAAEMAQQKASADLTRAYADRLVRDHQLADRKVRNMAMRLNVELRQPQPDDTRRQRFLKDMEEAARELDQLEGREFDTAFVDAMERSHQFMQSELSDAVDQLRAPELEAMLQRLIPILGQHIEMADVVRDEALAEEGTRS